MSFRNIFRSSPFSLPRGGQESSTKEVSILGNQPPLDSDKTLALLDFDNVFNTLSILLEHTPWTDGVTTSANMPSGQHGFSFSPTVANFFINRLDKLDCRWLSTWFDETIYYGERMGFPPLPCFDAGDLSTEVNAQWWKFLIVKKIVEEFPSQKILWIDDEIPQNPMDPIRVWLEEHKDMVSFIIPNDLQGLVHADLVRIENILSM